MSIKIEFLKRVEEVEIYFAFAKEIDSIETHKQKHLQISNTTQLNINRDLQKVIRANCYLILYNLTEATIRNGIWAIYDSIEDENIPYSNVSKQIQNLWLTEKAIEMNEISNLPKLKTNIKTLLEERSSGLGISFAKSRISMAGNLDYRSIEKLINEFGCHGKIKEKDKLKLGKTLLRIKNERNGLAHGNKSFRQSAEVVTVQELLGYKNIIVSYLSDVTDNIESFINRQAYRQP